MDQNTLYLDDKKTERLPTWRQMFFAFCRIGIVGFGPAMFAETKKIVVQKNQWINEDDLLNGLALSQLLPGATYVSLTAYIGHKINGVSGAALCAFAFLLPPFSIMILLSYLYFSLGSIPQVSLFFKGLSVIVAALIIHGVIEIGKSVILDFKSIAMALIAALFILVCPNVFIILVFGVLAGILLYSKSYKITSTGANLAVNPKVSFRLTGFLILLCSLGLFFITESFKPELLSLSWVFFRMGSLLFGGGMSMLPFIEQEVVRNHHWMTQDQFIVGIALGQTTPGPILITATFIGYKVAGFLGAIAATVGMFTPSLLLVTLIAGIHQKIRNNRFVKSAIKGIVASFNGLITVFAIKLAFHSLTESLSIILALTAFVLLRSKKLATGFVVLICTVAYWVIMMITF